MVPAPTPSRTPGVMYARRSVPNSIRCEEPGCLCANSVHQAPPPPAQAAPTRPQRTVVTRRPHVEDLPLVPVSCSDGVFYIDYSIAIEMDSFCAQLQPQQQQGRILPELSLTCLLPVELAVAVLEFHIGNPELIEARTSVFSRAELAFLERTRIGTDRMELRDVFMFALCLPANSVARMLTKKVYTSNIVEDFTRYGREYAHRKVDQYHGRTEEVIAMAASCIDILAGEPPPESYQTWFPERRLFHEFIDQITLAPGRETPPDEAEDSDLDPEHFPPPGPSGLYHPNRGYH